MMMWVTARRADDAGACRRGAGDGPSYVSRVCEMVKWSLKIWWGPTYEFQEQNEEKLESHSSHGHSLGWRTPLSGQKWWQTLKTGKPNPSSTKEFSSQKFILVQNWGALGFKIGEISVPNRSLKFSVLFSMWKLGCTYFSARCWNVDQGPKHTKRWLEMTRRRHGMQCYCDTIRIYRL